MVPGLGSCLIGNYVISQWVWVLAIVVADELHILYFYISAKHHYSHFQLTLILNYTQLFLTTISCVPTYQRTAFSTLNP